MILQKLVSENNWQFVIDFHPRITVISGLGAERRARMAAMIAAITKGDLFGLRADVILEETPIELTESVVRELELQRNDANVVLREQDLPGAVILQQFPKQSLESQRPNEPTDEEIIALVEREVALPQFVEPPPPTPNAAAARTPIDPSYLSRHQILATVYQEDLNGPLRTSWTALERALSERDRAAAELAEIEQRQQGGSLPSREEARDRATRAKSRLQEAEAALYQGGNVESELQQSTNALSDLYRQRDELATQLRDAENNAGYSLTSTTGVRGALDVLVDAKQSASQGTGAPSPVALALADELEQLDLRLYAHAPKNAPSWLIEQTQQQLDEARRKLQIAESEYQMAAADSTDIQAVEQAHQEVVKLEQSSGKLFGGGAAKKNLEAARQREASALERIGLPNYEAFRLQLGSLGRDKSVVDQMVQRARNEVSDAEAMWEELQVPSGDDPELMAIREEIAKKTAEGQQIVGTYAGTELISALRSHREQTNDFGAQQQALWIELQAVGVPRADADPQAIAEAWLAERENESNQELQRDQLRLQLRERIGAVEASLHETESERERLHARVSSLPMGVDLQGAVEQARNEYEEAERYLMGVEHQWQRLDDSRGDMASVQHMFEAAQLVYDKARAIFLESVQQVRARDAETDQATTRHDEERFLAHQEFEQKRSAILARREKLIAQLMRERDERIAQYEANQRWNYPFFQPPVMDVSGCVPEDVEVFVLSRLSAIRLVGPAGALPLIVDDAFGDFDEEALVTYLSLFARVSRVMQIVYLTEDPRVEEWASSLGSENARIQRFAIA